MPRSNAVGPSGRRVPLRATKARAQLRTIGLAPIGAPVRSTIEEGHSTVSTATPAIAPADRAQAIAKPVENKPDEKSRIAKKKQTRRLHGSSL